MIPLSGNAKEKKKKDHTENPHQNVVLETLTFPLSKRRRSSMATFTSRLMDDVVYYQA